MKAPDFSYLRVGSVSEAIAALARYGDDAVLLAGGQSLMPMLNFRISQPEVLIDISRVAELGGLQDHGDAIAIGAGVRYSQLLAHPLVATHLPLMHHALTFVAHEAVRNRGTLGGSLALADPAAEMGAVCLALNAQLRVVGPRGEREVSIEEWFTGLYETALARDEVLCEIRIAKQGSQQISLFDEFARRRGDFAIAGVALTATLDASALQAPRIALLGAADRPTLASRLMRSLSGCELAKLSDYSYEDELQSDINPLEDPSYPVQYKRHVLSVLVKRCLHQAADNLEVK